MADTDEAVIEKTPVEDDDDDVEDDESEDESFHGSEEEPASEDSDDDGGGRRSKATRSKPGGTGKASSEAKGVSGDYDFGIDADEIRDVTEAARELYGDDILREGGIGGAPGARGLQREAIERLWGEMLQESLLPVSMRTLERGGVAAATVKSAGKRHLGGLQSIDALLLAANSSGRQSNGLAGRGGRAVAALAAPPAKRRRVADLPAGDVATAASSTAAALAHTLSEGEAGAQAAHAVLGAVSSFGACLDSAGGGRDVAAPSAAPQAALSARQAQLREGSALAAALRQRLRGDSPSHADAFPSGAVPQQPAGSGPTAHSSASASSTSYFVVCSRSDALHARQQPARGSGTALWLPAPPPQAGQTGAAGSARVAGSASLQAFVDAAAAASAAAAATSSVGLPGAAAAAAGSQGLGLGPQQMAVDAGDAGEQAQDGAGLGATVAAATQPRRAPAAVDADTRARLLSAAGVARDTLAGRKIAVKQTVKFAGQTMTVTRLVDAGTQAAKAAVAPPQPKAAPAAGAAGPGGFGLPQLARRAAADVPSAAAAAGAEAGGAEAAAGAAAASSAGAPATAAAAGASSIGSLLASLDKPEAISTLAKTTLDWDSYKVTQGLDDELAAAGKEGVGFVGKQAFLSRVEGRQDQMAMDKRAVERARANAASAAGGGGARL